MKPIASLVTGSRRSRALAAIGAIESALRSHSDLPSDAPSIAERALFFAHLHVALDAPFARAEALTLLEQAIEKTGSQTLRPSLIGGFTEVGFVTAHLHRMLDLGAPDLDAIDDALAGYVSSERGGAFDLVSGLVGFGTYALEREPSNVTDTIVEAVLARLEGRAERTGKALRIWTAPSLLNVEARAHFPRGRFDLGIAHGAAGVVAWLAKATTRPRHAERARVLLRGVLRALLDARVDPAERCAFPAHVAPDSIGVDFGRAAWCYGEPGVAVALAAAAHALGDRALLTTAKEVALAVTRRPDAAAHVVDSALCHGALGLTHIYAHLGDACGADDLTDYAGHWLDVALASRDEEASLGGFGAHAGPQASTFHERTSLLTGAIGIGLALISAVAPGNASWGRLLLIDDRASKYRIETPLEKS